MITKLVQKVADLNSVEDALVVDVTANVDILGIGGEGKIDDIRQFPRLLLPRNRIIHGQ